MAEVSTTLLDLPVPALVKVLEHVDVFTRIAAARSCTCLLKVAGSSILWPHYQPEGFIVTAIRLCLSRVLRLPPQVFAVNVAVHQSLRFPLSVSLHNLRAYLGITSVEDLAATTASTLQELVDKLPQHLTAYPVNGQLPIPLAVIANARADRGCVRLSLRPAVAVPLALQEIDNGAAAAAAASGAPAVAVLVNATCALNRKAWPAAQLPEVSNLQYLDQYWPAWMEAWQEFYDRCNKVFEQRIQPSVDNSAVLGSRFNKVVQQSRRRSGGWVPSLETFRCHALRLLQEQMGRQVPVSEDVLGATIRLFILLVPRTPDAPEWYLDLAKPCEQVACYFMLRSLVAGIEEVARTEATGAMLHSTSDINTPPSTPPHIARRVWGGGSSSSNGAYLADEASPDGAVPASKLEMDGVMNTGWMSCPPMFKHLSRTSIDFLAPLSTCKPSSAAGLASAMQSPVRSSSAILSSPSNIPTIKQLAPLVARAATSQDVATVMLCFNSLHHAVAAAQESHDAAPLLQLLAAACSSVQELLRPPRAADPLHLHTPMSMSELHGSLQRRLGHALRAAVRQLGACGDHGAHHSTRHDTHDATHVGPNIWLSPNASRELIKYCMLKGCLRVMSCCVWLLGLLD